MKKTAFPELPGQLLKFAVVGLSSNIILYCLYLSLTYFSVAPKYAMTLLYVCGLTQTFIFNKRWTFQHFGIAKVVLFRYVGSYLFGYLLNLSILYIWVDRLGFPHQIVQGCTIILLACVLFLLQKFWVFK